MNGAAIALSTVVKTNRVVADCARTIDTSNFLAHVRPEDHDVSILTAEVVGR